MWTVCETAPEVFSALLRGDKISQTGNALGLTNRSGSSCHRCTLFMFRRLPRSLAPTPSTNLSSCSKTCFSNLICASGSFFAQEDCGNPGLWNPAELVCVVLLPDPLRSGQRRGDPLQHHWSRCRSAAERHLQHRPHQRQHVCHAAPRQRGQGLFPCKNKTSLVLPPHCPSSVCLIIPPSRLPFSSSAFRSFLRLWLGSPCSLYRTVPSQQPFLLLMIPEPAAER